MNIKVFLINWLIILPMITQADDCLTLKTLTSDATKIVVSGTLSYQNKAGYFPFEFQVTGRVGLTYFENKAEKIRLKKATDDFSLLLIGDKVKIRSGTDVEIKLYFSGKETKIYRVRGINYIVNDVGQMIWKTDENFDLFLWDILNHFKK